MKTKVNFDDFKKLDKELEYLKNHVLVIGVLGDEKSEDGVPVKKYAMWVEFGNQKFNVLFPARPFFRVSTQIPSAKKDIENYMQTEVNSVITGKKTGIQALNSVGLYIKGKIIQNIVRKSWRPNAPSTIKKKRGRNTPLRDTGTLLESIDYEIRRI